MSATPDTDAAKRKAGEAKRDRIDLLVDAVLGAIVAILGVIAVLFSCSLFSGCATSYKGGKVVDGTNLEIGMTVPGTQWTINFLSFTGGMKVGANDGARLEVTNEVWETNSYFGVISTSRHTRTNAAIEPTIAEPEAGKATGREGETPSDEPPPDAAQEM